MSLDCTAWTAIGRGGAGSASRNPKGIEGDSTSGLVGAAGFEPTTCSTQNCRATRLRYTPNSSRPRRYTLQGPPARLAVFPLRRRFQTLFASEQRMGDAVAGPDTVFLRRAGRH